MISRVGCTSYVGFKPLQAGILYKLCSTNCHIAALGGNLQEEPLHVDLQEFSASEAFHSTVCVIGGGIAGLVLAMRLAQKGIAVHLLEAGGLSLEERSQDLYRVDMKSEVHLGATDGRYRTFGGSSTRWGGQLLPFTADVFLPPSGTPSLPWPIEESDLEPYYADLQRMLGVNSLPFTADLLPALKRSKAPVSTDVTVRFSKWIPFNRRNLADSLGAETLVHPLVTVFTHANATQLEASCDHGHIGSLRVSNYDCREFRFSATHFVVCVGTIESSRLLLCSPDVPNPDDQIGRYFHDHVSYHAARFLSPGRERVLDLFGPSYVDGTMHTAKLEASPRLRSKESLQNVMAHVVILEPEDSGVAAIRNLLRSLQSRNLRRAIIANLMPVLRGAGDVARLWYYSRFKGRRAVSKRAALMLNIDVEQAPHPDNRISLSATETDAIGLPRAVLDWRIRAPELDTAVRYVPIVLEYLSAAGVDSLEWEREAPAMVDTYHMMGGLRMGVDPASSVVDTDLKVHGLSNLHIASCAVFPSGSSSNPTFTLMALTLRLADQLAEKCR